MAKYIQLKTIYAGPDTSVQAGKVVPVGGRVSKALAEQLVKDGAAIYVDAPTGMEKAKTYDAEEKAAEVDASEQVITKKRAKAKAKIEAKKARRFGKKKAAKTSSTETDTDTEIVPPDDKKKPAKKMQGIIEGIRRGPGRPKKQD